MADFPDGSSYSDQPLHPHTDLFRDIPISGTFAKVRDPDTGRKRRIWRPTRRGVITLPATASRIAEHAELVGFRLDPALAVIKRIDPIRGGKSITNPGDWADVSAPEPPPNPVAVVAAAAADLMPAELLELRDRIDEQLGGQTG